MIYILETKLLETKSIFYALNSVYGIGKKQAFTVCNKLGFSHNLKVKQFSMKILLPPWLVFKYYVFIWKYYLNVIITCYFLLACNKIDFSLTYRHINQKI